MIQLRISRQIHRLILKVISSPFNKIYADAGSSCCCPRYDEFHFENARVSQRLSELGTVPNLRERDISNATQLLAP